MGDAVPCASLLLELGVEDIPAKVVYQFGKIFAREMEQRLVADGFKSACDEALSKQHFATPRRLAFLIDDVLAQLPARPVTRKGPTLASAYRPDGEPTPAAIGFAKSCGVAVSDLQHKDDRAVLPRRAGGCAFECAFATPFSQVP